MLVLRAFCFLLFVFRFFVFPFLVPSSLLFVLVLCLVILVRVLALVLVLGRVGSFVFAVASLGFVFSTPPLKYQETLIR